MTLEEVEGILRSMRLRYTRHGYRIRSQCPCHEDNEPSLVIDWNQGKVRVKCFAGCRSEEILQALNMGIKTTHAFLPYYSKGDCNFSKGLDILTLACYEAAKYAHPSSERELQRRGIAQNRYGILDATRLVRELRKIDPNDLIEAGLAYRKRGELVFPRAFASNRIVIPYWREGRVMSVRSRRVSEDGTPKYLSLRGYPSRAYIARSLPGTRLVVVEGEFKAMVLSEHLNEDISVIALPGIHTAWKDLEDICRKTGFCRRMVLFDTERNNPQVEKAARRLAIRIRGDVIRLPIEEGESRTAPDDFVLKYGAKDLEQVIMEI